MVSREVQASVVYVSAGKCDVSSMDELKCVQTIMRNVMMLSEAAGRRQAGWMRDSAHDQ